MPTTGSALWEDIITNNAIRPEQKLAMTVLKQAKQDIERGLTKTDRTMTERRALASALQLLVVGGQELEFWCMIAGWPVEGVQRQANELVREVNWRPLLVAKRKPPGGAAKRKPDHLVTKAALYKRMRKDGTYVKKQYSMTKMAVYLREWKRKRREENVSGNSEKTI